MLGPTVLACSTNSCGVHHRTGHWHSSSPSHEQTPTNPPANLRRWRAGPLFHRHEGICVASPGSHVWQSVGASAMAPWNKLSQGGWAVWCPNNSRCKGDSVFPQVFKLCQVQELLQMLLLLPNLSPSWAMGVTSMVWSRCCPSVTEETPILQASWYPSAASWPTKLVKHPSSAWQLLSPLMLTSRFLGYCHNKHQWPPEHSSEDLPLQKMPWTGLQVSKTCGCRFVDRTTKLIWNCCLVLCTHNWKSRIEVTLSFPGENSNTWTLWSYLYPILTWHLLPWATLEKERALLQEFGSRTSRVELCHSTSCSWSGSSQKKRSSTSCQCLQGFLRARCCSSFMVDSFGVFWVFILKQKKN